MQCAAIAQRSGKQCQRRAAPGARFCEYHRDGRVARTRNARATGDRQTQSGAAILINGDPSTEIGMENEIAMLRRQISEADQMGDAEAVRRGVETLSKALKVQHVIVGKSGESLTEALSKILEEVGAETSNE